MISLGLVFNAYCMKLHWPIIWKFDKMLRGTCTKNKGKNIRKLFVFKEKVLQICGVSFIEN